MPQHKHTIELTLEDKKAHAGSLVLSMGQSYSRIVPAGPSAEVGEGMEAKVTIHLQDGKDSGSFDISLDQSLPCSMKFHSWEITVTAVDWNATGDPLVAAVKKVKLSVQRQSS